MDGLSSIIHRPVFIQALLCITFSNVIIASETVPRNLQYAYVPVDGDDMEMQWGVAEQLAEPISPQPTHSGVPQPVPAPAETPRREGVSDRPSRPEGRPAQFEAMQPRQGVEERATDEKKQKIAEMLEEATCIDAKARGYESPFVCCSIQDGDWWDRKTWSCNRVPTHLDAVFIRHFVRIPDHNLSEFLGVTTPDIQIRALWLIESVDPAFSGLHGVLRAGTFFDICLDPQAASNYMPTSQKRALRNLFMHYTDENTLRGLCESFRSDLFPNEKDYANEELINLRISPPKMPVAGEDIVAVINMSFASEEKDASKLGRKGRGSSGSIVSQNDALEALKQRLRTERREAAVASPPRGPEQRIAAENKPVPPEMMSEIQRRQSEIDQLREAEAEARARVAELSVLLQSLQSSINGPHVASARPSDSQPIGGETELTPYRGWNSGDDSVADYLGSAPRLEVPNILQQRFPNQRNLQGSDTMTLEEYEKLQNGETSGVAMPSFDITGPSTMRIEDGAALLLFEQLAVSVASGIRNHGTFFIGEARITACLEDLDFEDRGRCRVPSLSSEGYIVAANAMTVSWLQLSEATTLGSNQRPVIRQLWQGIVQYGTDLPRSEQSVLTVYGNVVVEKIAVGFTLSFRRIGFPPHPSLQRALIDVLDTKESSDLLIYVDIFDDDGFENCCEDTYEDRVAEFEVTGANLKLMRYQSFNKEIGDPSKRISEQIVIRAPRITTDQMFQSMDNYIADADAVLTNTETPIKRAGINHDIVYFQCLISCQVTNQSFLQQDPYLFVQVKRSLPRDRFG